MFGNLGNMAGLMKKAAEMQSNVKKMKEELANLELSGKSSGGQVEIVVSGDMQIRRVCINPDCLAAGTAALEAAVQEAANAALLQIKAESAKRLSVATGGLSNSFTDGLV